jgi:hypothetical protein
MADAWSWQPLLTAATALLTPVLTAFLPRLWQDESRRLQSESETRVKKLEALEKAMSTAGRAKSELEISVNTHELQFALERIVHEFAGPIVLSQEALEDWTNKSLKERLLTTPRFWVPVRQARMVRLLRSIGVVAMLFLFAYFPVSSLIAAIHPELF